VNNPIAADRNNVDTITDDVIEISPEIDNQQPGDDDLERFENEKSIYIQIFQFLALCYYHVKQ
jgi:hypothetical protein